MEDCIMSNDEVARVLFQCAAVLEMVGDNPYRIRAYRRAGIGVLFLPRPLVDYVAEQVDIPIPALGSRIRRRIVELVNTGRMDAHQALLEDLGEPLVSLLAIPGVGPRTAVRLVRELGIQSLEELAYAAREHKIQSLRGFGAVREAQLAQRVDDFLAGAAA